MTTNEIEEIVKQFKKKFVNYEPNDTLVCRASLIENFLYESLLAYGEKEYKRGREEQRVFDGECLNTQTAKYEV